MVAKSGSKVNIGAEPAKLAIAGVLVVVLVIVLAVQFKGEKQPKFAVKRRVVRSAVTNPPRVDPKISDPSLDLPKLEERTWPEFSLEEVLQNDPFRATGELANLLASGRTAGSEEQHRKQQRAQAAALLRRQGVGIIFQDRRGPAATIGDRILREGDALDGFRVVKIGRDGIVLSDSEEP